MKRLFIGAGLAYATLLIYSYVTANKAYRETVEPRDYITAHDLDALHQNVRRIQQP